MAKITEKENIMAQDTQEEQVPVSPADPEQTPTPEPEEPTELGITLPDEAAAVEQLTPTDRLLGFDTDGNPVTATVQQLKDYAQKEIPFVGENLCRRSAFTYSRSQQGALVWLPLSEKLTPGETYSISATVEESDGGLLYLVLCEKEGSYNDQQRVDNNGTFVAKYPSGALLVYQQSEEGSTSASHIKLESGSKITPYTQHPDDLAQVIPFSLEEQAVPGEFWDGRQVYVRSFQGSVHAAIGGNYIAVNCFRNAVNIVEASGSISGYIGEDSRLYSYPVGNHFHVSSLGNSLTYATDRNDMSAMTYTITIKYVYEA